MPHDRDQSTYDRTRRRFDELPPEDQARFLVEATASSLARGVEQVGQLLAEGIGRTVRRARRRSKKSPSGRAAEPETAQRRRPRSDSEGPASSPTSRG